MTLYGEPPGARLTSYRVDKLGVHLATARTPFVERNGPFDFDRSRTSAPALNGLPVVAVGLRERNGGGLEIEYEYEGRPGSDSGGQITSQEVTYGQQEKPIFEFIPTQVERSLLAHPRWLELSAKYGGTDAGGRAEFPPQMPNEVSFGGAGLGGVGVQFGAANPMFGQTTYRDVGGVFQATFVERIVPGGIFNGIGTVIAAPPGLGEIGMTTPAGRNWLVLSPVVRNRGNVVQISLQYELSGPGGHNKDVYSFGQLG